MLKISLLFKKNTADMTAFSLRFNDLKILLIKNAKFSVYYFIWIRIYGEIFKFALVYL